MKARYKYRFYPTKQQQQKLAHLFGCVRVVYNNALASTKASGKYSGYNQLSKALTLNKKNEDRKWLKDVASIPLQQALRHLDKAYKNFFSSCKGQRKGKKMNPPRFKKKTNAQSATFTRNGFSISGDSVHLLKIGNLKPIWSRELPSKPSSLTVIKDAANRYFLSFVVEVESEAVEAKNQSIGIDLGIKPFASMSNGEKAKSPNYRKTDLKIRKLQRKLMKRQIKGSNRQKKTRLKIAKLYNKIADTRRDFLHKLSTKVVRENQSIILEDLNVLGMLKNHKISRAISLQGWREFRILCEAKANKFSRQFSVISRWKPTSQICSDCGYKWGKLDLKVRTVTCVNCGSVHDRDENASKNIQKVGIGYCHDYK
jgi:putative transposase